MTFEELVFKHTGIKEEDMSFNEFYTNVINILGYER